MKRQWVVILILATSDTFAYDATKAKSLLAGDLANCAAYYAHAKHNLPPDLAATAQRASDRAWTLAVKYSSEPEAHAATKSAILGQKALIVVEPTGYWDMSKLTEKYADTCKMAVFKTDERMKYWLDKSD
jgi:hypothetical protein